MGKVYLLEETDPRRSLVYRPFLAAKTFKPGFSPNAVRNELRIWAKLVNQNILPLLAIGSLDDRLAALSPWRKSGTLQEHMGHPAFVRVLPNVVEQIISALKYAWDCHQTVHLDLKPNNVFVGKTTGEIELADWGISSISSQVTISQIKKGEIENCAGTLPYMSPERFMGSYVPSIKADMYSLGILTFQALTGSLPFSSSETMIEEITRGTYCAAISRRIRNDHSRWMSFLSAATAFFPDKRPSTYQGLLQLLPSNNG